MTKLIDAIRNFAKASKLFTNIDCIKSLIFIQSWNPDFDGKNYGEFQKFSSKRLGSICNTFLAQKQFSAINLTSRWNKYVFSDVLSLIYIMIIILII